MIKYSAIEKAHSEYEMGRRGDYPPGYYETNRHRISMKELIAIMGKVTDIEFDRRKGERRDGERRKGQDEQPDD